MCDGDKKCTQCKSRTARVVETNKATVKIFDGRKVVVVPVVMARADVVMNGGLLPVEEYEPLSWAGIPVTVGHPNTKGQFASARDPAIHEEWVVGMLYNVSVEDNALRGEAYIDIQKADQIYPGLVNDLVKGTPIDVSTGYYCSTEQEGGSVNGREYFEVQRDVIPDHLALLPNEEGACNWKDGCGVRSNLMETTLKKARMALKVIANALATGDKKPSAATVDDIIANARSLYTEEDRESLSKMSTPTLNKIAALLANAEEDPEEEIENAEDPEEEAANAEDEEMKDKKNSALTAADREALQFARNHAADHRRSLVSKITSNTAMKAKDLEGFSLSQLELMANGLPTGSYQGRAAANAGEEDSLADGMMSTGVLNTLRKKKDAA